jgi:two-component system NarL family sensor kinase
LVELLPVWGWMLGTGLHYDTINQGVARERARLKAGIGSTFGAIVAVLALITLVAAVLVLLTNLHQGRLASRHLQSLVHHYISQQIAERRGFARELHDGINQLIAAAKYRIEAALTQAAQGQAE